IVIRTRGMLGSDKKDEFRQHIFLGTPEGAYVRLEDQANAINWKNSWRNSEEVSKRVTDITDYVNKALEGK
ncbi:MAG TPA: hypothetical protein VJC07_00565, partial [Candidatus Nanoarchaeia archaeon]|nr:hypothetical protein [Candidatus Nanoarchaeia archaeon]